MIFPKNDLDLVLVPGGLVIMFAYHLFFLCRYRYAPETTVMGIENADRRAWIDGISEVKLGDRNFAANVIASSVTAATSLASVSLALSSLLGAWIANSTADDMFRRLRGFGGTDPSTAAVKYMSLLACFILACFILAFAFFLQSARHFIHANYLITTQDDSAGSEAVKENAKVVIARGGEFWSLGLRAICSALALLLWFFGPVAMFVSSAILVMILYHHDFRSIPLARTRRLKTGSGGVQ